jgi:hypothetical protein
MGKSVMIKDMPMEFGMMVTLAFAVVGGGILMTHTLPRKMTPDIAKYRENSDFFKWGCSGWWGLGRVSIIL